MFASTQLLTRSGSQAKKFPEWTHQHSDKGSEVPEARLSRLIGLQQGLQTVRLPRQIASDRFRPLQTAQTSCHVDDATWVKVLCIDHLPLRGPIVHLLLE